MKWIKDNYEKLYEQVKAGKRVVCYVDYDACRDGSFILRDIYDRYIDPEKNEQEIFLSECQRRNVEWLDESEPAPSPDPEAEAEVFYPTEGKAELIQICHYSAQAGYLKAARRYATTVEAKEREIADLKDTADGIEKDLRALKQENERLNTLIAHYELSEANYKKTLHIQRQLIEQSKDCFKKVKELEDENARLQKLVAHKIE